MIQDQCVNGPDGTIFYKSNFPLFAANAMGKTATILMFLITMDQFFIYFVLRDIQSEKQRNRKMLAFFLLALTITHFLFDIMEQSKAITFRLSELNRCFFLMISMYFYLKQCNLEKIRLQAGCNSVEISRNHRTICPQLAVFLSSS